MKFKDEELECFWYSPDHYYSKRFDVAFKKTLYRKLQIINAAYSLNDLLVPPGNRLEALKGKRKGQYSIRVNRQWRLCFYWDKGEAKDLELCDYHS